MAATVEHQAGARIMFSIAVAQIDVETGAAAVADRTGQEAADIELVRVDRDVRGCGKIGHASSLSDCRPARVRHARHAAPAAGIRGGKRTAAPKAGRRETGPSPYQP